MTLRLRYHLSFLPLFLGLAAAAVGLGWLVVDRQVSWALAQEAEGYAVGLAGFIGSAADGAATDVPRQKNLAFEMSRFAGGLTVDRFEQQETSWHGQRLNESPGLREAPAPSREVLRRLEAGQAASLRISRRDAPFDEAIGYAALPGRDGARLSVVAVTAKDTLTRAEMRELWRNSAWLALAAVFASIVVAEALTRRAQRDMAALADGAVALAAGNYAHDWSGSMVKELDELALTLKAIGRILGDNVRQTRRHFLRAEQLPSDEEIATACEAVCAASDVPDGAPQVAVRQVAGGAPDEFWRLHRTEKGWHVIVGRIATPEPVPPRIERTLRAHAAADLLCGLLRDGTEAAAWRELDTVFHLQRGASMSLLGNGELLTVQAEGRDRMVTSGEIGETALHAVGTLEPGAMRFAHDYLRSAPGTDLTHAADELTSLLAERGRGLLVVFSAPKR